METRVKDFDKVDVRIGTIVVAPSSHYGQPNGGLLALIQRLFYIQSHQAMPKPDAGIAVCRRGSTRQRRHADHACLGTQYGLPDEKHPFSDACEGETREPMHFIR